MSSKKDYSFVGNIRGIGLLSAIELVKNRETKEPNCALAERGMYKALDRGLSFKASSGNAVVLVSFVDLFRRGTFTGR